MADPATRTEKALVMLIAAIQANAAMTAWGPLSTNHPASADISDANLRLVNLENWEEFRIFYNATLTALNDDTNWKAPDIGVSTLINTLTPTGLSGLVSGLLPLLAGVLTGPGGAAITTIIQTILSALNTTKPVTPTPAPPVPNPGQ